MVKAKASVGMTFKSRGILSASFLSLAINISVCLIIATPAELFSEKPELTQSRIFLEETIFVDTKFIALSSFFKQPDISQTSIISKTDFSEKVIELDYLHAGGNFIDKQSLLKLFKQAGFLLSETSIQERGIYVFLWPSNIKPKLLPYPQNAYTKATKATKVSEKNEELQQLAGNEVFYEIQASKKQALSLTLALAQQPSKKNIVWIKRYSKNITFFFKGTITSLANGLAQNLNLNLLAAAAPNKEETRASPMQSAPSKQFVITVARTGKSFLSYSQNVQFKEE